MDWWPYLALFGVAFAAATLLPAQSELVLGAMLAGGRHDTGLLLTVATAGNVLGSLANWTIGRFLRRYRDRRWFPVPSSGLDRAERIYQRWGVWTLLLAWVPVVGDPLTLVAGVLKTPLRLFLPLVIAAKLGRYLVVAGAVTLLTGT